MRYFHPKLLRLIGTWTLVATTNKKVPLRSELLVDYEDVEFTTIQSAGVTRLRRTCFGRIVGGEVSNVVWLKLTDLTVDTGILPPIQVPVPPQPMYRMRLGDVVEDEATASFTVVADKHHYTFHRTIGTREKDTMLKLFATQLVFDAIIHLKDNPLFLEKK
jgi:hypothetical protein